MSLALKLATPLLALAALAHGVSPGYSAERWSAKPIDDASAYRAAVAERRAPAPSAIPFMLTAASGAERVRGRASIARAWYGEPTARYRHGVLGDAIEGGALVAELTNGRRVTYRLRETMVFEDIAPRLADLDNDGGLEIVAIVSSVTQGAAVAVYGLSGDALVEKARSNFIGRANRWLNIAAIDHFTGGVTPEIVFVETPHIGGRLYFLKYVPGTLLRFGGTGGFSNHVIGSPELRLSAVADIDSNGRADLALPSADRRKLRIVSLGSGGITDLAVADLPARVTQPIAVSGAGRRAVFTMGLDDGSVVAVSRQ